MDLKGKVAIVTGGGTGIGEAITRRFVADGARVCITGRRQHMLDQVARSLPSGTVKTCAADVSDPKDVDRMVETALSFGLGLQVIVNNAGMEQAPLGGVVDIDVELWRKVLDINLTGPFLLMKAAIPHMIKAGGGIGHQYRITGGVAKYPQAARLLRIEGRTYQPYPAGRARLRPRQSTMQRGLPGGGKNGHVRERHGSLLGRFGHECGRGSCRVSEGRSSPSHIHP
jgi:NAD(P)-dependent dehydrogenase (short-subunit alcohol dehydrogenase family)